MPLMSMAFILYRMLMQERSIRSCGLSTLKNVDLLEDFGGTPLEAYRSLDKEVQNLTDEIQAVKDKRQEMFRKNASRLLGARIQLERFSDNLIFGNLRHEPRQTSRKNTTSSAAGCPKKMQMHLSKRHREMTRFIS
mgnify:FL=1